MKSKNKSQNKKRGDFFHIFIIGQRLPPLNARSKIRAMKSNLTTLCYLEREEKWLMLHRDAKKNDINEGKWIGVGGHFEKEESPDECLLREVKEETGYTLNSFTFRGIVTFVSDNTQTEYMHIFTSNDFSGNEIRCTEGTLQWIEKDKIESLNVWEGDRIFLEMLKKNEPFFSLKLVYKNGFLSEKFLNGKAI